MESYHPKNSTREIADKNAITSLLKGGNYCVIALCYNDTPYIVTLSYGYDEKNNCLYFHGGKDGHKTDIIKKNPNACATIIKDNGYLDEQCDHDYETLVIRGKISILDELNAKKKGLEVIFRHLASKPESIISRIFGNEELLGKVSVMRFDMDSIVGKKYVEKQP